MFNRKISRVISGQANKHESEQLKNKHPNLYNQSGGFHQKIVAAAGANPRAAGPMRSAFLAALKKAK